MSNKINTMLWCGNAFILRVINLKLLLAENVQLEGGLRNYAVVNVMVNVGKMLVFVFFFFCKLSVIIGYQIEIKRTPFFSHKRDYFHTKFINTSNVR